MKTGSKLLGPTFLGLCASIGCAGLVHAQAWQPITVCAAVSLVTTGSITYAEYTWGLMGCEDVVSIGPVIRNGSNFSFNFNLLEETGVPCPLYVILETTRSEERRVGK